MHYEDILNKSCVFHNDKNKFYVDFSDNNQVTKTILFLPEKDYFITTMFCPLDIRPGITQSKQYKEVNELSDFGKELKSSGANVFFNINLACDRHSRLLRKGRKNV